MRTEHMQTAEGEANDILAPAATGDLVLFSGKGLVSAMIRLFTRSRWSHVGLVIRDGVSGTPLLLEATITEESADTVLGRPVRGVQVVRLADKLVAYDGTVVLRRLEIDERPAGLAVDIREDMREMAALWRYRGYKSFTMTLILDLLSANRRPPRVHRVFCSELVAEMYKRHGLMTRTVRSSRYVPGDFGLVDTPFLENARLSAPILLKS